MLLKQIWKCSYIIKFLKFMYGNEITTESEWSVDFNKKKWKIHLICWCIKYENNIPSWKFIP